MRIAIKAAGTTHAAVRKEAVEDPWMNSLDMMGFMMIAVLKQWKKVERKLSAIGNKKKVCECIYTYIYM